MTGKGTIMKTKRKPDHISQEDWEEVDSPELTDEMLQRMRPASEVVPDIVAEYRRSRGRPPKAVTKIATTLRLDADIVDSFRRTGKGWQTRLNEALRDWLLNHPTA
ncbi:MAG: BrnA antitoxin family protein [Leptospirillum sp.]